MRKRPLVRALVAATAVFAVLAIGACYEAPPKIAAIPPSGLALRVYAFGASAQDLRQTFEAVKQNNKQFSVVQDGGDGEILIGLDNDSPKCVAPTALCSYRVAYRIRDNAGRTLVTTTTNAAANSDRCADLCQKVLINVVVKAVEQASSLLKGSSGVADDASVDPGDAGPPADAATDAAGDAGAGGAGGAAGKTPASKKGKAEPAPRAIPPMCTVGPGAHLPAQEAETRAAQVEALKRLNVLDQAEYDCLRKAYLDRL
jgi:hypothetical protein